jgi:hypothetical protein
MSSSVIFAIFVENLDFSFGFSVYLANTGRQIMPGEMNG